MASIAIIHEELHESKGAGTLNFSSYLESLVENLFHTYRLGNVDLSLSMELEKNIFFDMDIAVPLGLIVNEIVSNSLKYAFPGGDKGVIRIKLYREDLGKCAKSKLESKKGDYTDTNFILIVADDGVGMPESFNLDNSDTLGIQLVVALVDQLGGELELARDQGTRFVIRFTVAEKQYKS